MTPIQATLVKLQTDDGLVQVQAGRAEVGKRYTVDLDSIVENVKMQNVEKQVVHHKDIIYTIDGGWFPLELLKLAES